MKLCRIALLPLLLSLIGCGDESGEETTPERTYNPRVCLPSAGVSGSPQTIEDTVALINSFPMPVSLPCLLQSLDRPLSLSATNSSFSAQPAYGPNNPRIFVLVGDLELSVVPKGDSRELLEFGLKRTEGRSLKGELHFPVESELDPDDPYTRVLQDDESTACAFCHFNETLDKTIPGGNAYISEIIDIDKYERVELDYLRWSFDVCRPDVEPDRCAMFDAIFAHGEVVEKDY